MSRYLVLLLVVPLGCASITPARALVRGAPAPAVTGCEDQADWWATFAPVSLEEVDAECLRARLMSSCLKICELKASCSTTAAGYYEKESLYDSLDTLRESRCDGAHEALVEDVRKFIGQKNLTSAVQCW